MLKVCATDGDTKLRDLIFEKTNTNAFPSVFAVILLAFHEIIVGEGKRVADYSAVKSALNNLSKRIEQGRKATSADERRKNIDSVKGLIASNFVKEKKLPAIIYTNHSTLDIESVIRRSEIELGNYELKQGLLLLEDKVKEDADMIGKVVNTICAIANIGPKSEGEILIGVTNKKADADRIKKIDGTTAKKVGKRYVVGVNREAKRLKITAEQYFSKWKEGIKNSGLSPHLRDAVLSNMDFNSFFGLGVMVITIPSQTQLSYVGENLYWRNGDATELATSAKQIANIASRFPK